MTLKRYSVSGVPATAPLARHKQYFVTVIDEEISDRIINNGIEFPAGNGTYLSTSVHAQLDWTGALAMKDALTYPFDTATKDDTAVVSVTGATDIEYICGAIATVVQTHRAAGAAAKMQVNAAVDLAAAQAAFDAYMAG